VKNVHDLPVFYQDIIQGSQEKIWQNYSNNKLRGRLLRKKLLYYGGDAVTYRYQSDEPNSNYIRIHERVHEGIKRIFSDMRDSRASLVIIAQSFGGQVISNFLWDAQNKIGLGEKAKIDDIENLKNIVLLITTGCNIPLFVSGVTDPQAIDPPNVDNFHWYNIFDSNDVLGWPLRPLSHSYARVVSEDIPVHTGLWLGSHVKYWKRRKVIKLIAEKIQSAWDSLSNL
jgi:hypothetical protein